MNSKWIKLNWTRTKSLKYPKIWRTFKAPDLNSSKLVEYRIQDLPETRHEDAISNMKAFYLKDEPVSRALDVINDLQYVADYEFVCRSILQQNSSLVCFRSCSDKIVGVLTQYVVTRADSFSSQAYERCKSPKTKKMYDVDSVLTKKFNAFDAFGVSEYLYLHNVAVDSRFRGLNVGLKMLNTSIDFCRESNIKLIHGVFTSDFSSKMSDEIGFKTDLAISFEELNKLHPELGTKNIKSKELSLKSFVL